MATVTEDQGTPIFDQLAEEVGFEPVAGWFDAPAASEPRQDG